MKDKSLTGHYQQILGETDPWAVSEVRLDVLNAPFSYVDPFGLVQMVGTEPCDLSTYPEFGEGGRVNCVTYAVNRPLGSGIPPSLAKQTKFDCTQVMAALMQDFVARTVPKDGCCPSGYHKIAVFKTPPKSELQDIHLLRKNRDGSWSHVVGDEGVAPPSGVDAAGHTITDPRVADLDYREQGAWNYSIMCGSLCTKTTPDPEREKEYIDALEAHEEFRKELERRNAPRQ